MILDYCSRRPVVGGLTVVAALLAITALNRWIFEQVWSTDYLNWYANAGPFIALAMGAFGLAWGGLDRNPRLISAHPCEYLAATFQVAGLPMAAFGPHFRSENQAAPVPAWEILAAIPVVLALVVATLGWLVFIVPMQYFVFLVCGAPVRIAMRSSVKVEARFAGRSVLYEERPRDQPVPAGWWDASMRDRPVTLTSAFSAALLFLIDHALKYFGAA